MPTTNPSPELCSPVVVYGAETRNPPRADPLLGFKVAHFGIELLEPEGSATWLCSPVAEISTFRDALGSG